MAGKATKTKNWLRKGLFNNIRIRLQEAVVEIGPEPFDPGDGIADGLRQRGFAGDTGELDAEPRVEIIKDRLGLGLPQSHPFIRRRSTRLFLDGVKLGDAPDRLFCNGRALGWTLLKKVEASCDRFLIAGGANVEADREQGPSV